MTRPDPAPNAAPPVERPPRSLLFVARVPEDRAADAVRDIAFDLGLHAGRSVLLLDLAIPANDHRRSFAEAGLLMPRGPLQPGPAGHAVLQFERLRGTSLYVSRVSPGPDAFPATTWDATAKAGLPRLLGLFSTVIVAGPDLSLSPGGLYLAAGVEGVVLVLRSGGTSAEQARELRDRVARAGGRLIGSVMTDRRNPGEQRRA